MASHLLDEVEKVCTHVAILKRGNLLISGPVDEVLVNEDIVEVASTDNKKLTEVLHLMNGYKTIRDQGKIVQLLFPVGTAKLDSINQHCFDNGIVLNHLQLKKKSLETKFFELTNN